MRFGGWQWALVVAEEGVLRGKALKWRLPVVQVPESSANPKRRKSAQKGENMCTLRARGKSRLPIKVLYEPLFCLVFVLSQEPNLSFPHLPVRHEEGGHYVLAGKRCLREAG
jgi:hypothetical protein